MKRLSGKFPWSAGRRSSIFSTTKKYGSTSSFYNPGHFPVISEPILEFSTADFVNTTDITNFDASVKAARAAPVPSIHQYPPSQHALNTRNSVMLVSRHSSAALSSSSASSSPNLSRGSVSTFRRGSTIAGPSSSPSAGVAPPRPNHPNHSGLLISANTTNPLASPKISDRDSALAAASTVASINAANAVFPNISSANSVNIVPSAATTPPLGVSDCTGTDSATSANNNNNNKLPKSPPTPLPSSSSPPTTDEKATSTTTLADPAAPPLLPPQDYPSTIAELYARLEHTDKKAIDVLIDYQEKLASARKRITDLEGKLVQETKAKRELSAQAAQATATALVAQSSILPQAPPQARPDNHSATSETIPADDAADQVAATPMSPPHKPAQLNLASAQDLPQPPALAQVLLNQPGSPLYPGTPTSARFNTTNMTTAQLQARVAALESQRESLRDALKSLRTTKDLEIKQYQDQLSRLKKLTSYQETINAHQSTLLYYSSTNGSSKTPSSPSPSFPSPFSATFPGNGNTSPTVGSALKGLSLGASSSDDKATNTLHMRRRASRGAGARHSGFIVYGTKHVHRRTGSMEQQRAQSPAPAAVATRHSGGDHSDHAEDDDESETKEDEDETLLSSIPTDDTRPHSSLHATAYAQGPHSDDAATHTTAEADNGSDQQQDAAAESAKRKHPTSTSSSSSTSSAFSSGVSDTSSCSEYSSPNTSADLTLVLAPSASISKMSSSTAHATYVQNYISATAADADAAQGSTSSSSSNSVGVAATPGAARRKPRLRLKDDAARTAAATRTFSSAGRKADDNDDNDDREDDDGNETDKSGAGGTPTRIPGLFAAAPVSPPATRRAVSSS